MFKLLKARGREVHYWFCPDLNRRAPFQIYFWQHKFQHKRYSLNFRGSILTMLQFVAAKMMFTRLISIIMLTNYIKKTKIQEEKRTKRQKNKRTKKSRQKKQMLFCNLWPTKMVMMFTRPISSIMITNCIMLA